MSPLYLIIKTGEYISYDRFISLVITFIGSNGQDQIEHSLKAKMNLCFHLRSLEKQRQGRAKPWGRSAVFVRSGAEIGKEGGAQGPMICSKPPQEKGGRRSPPCCKQIGLVVAGQGLLTCSIIHYHGFYGGHPLLSWFQLSLCVQDVWACLHLRMRTWGGRWRLTSDVSAAVTVFFLLN